MRSRHNLASVGKNKGTLAGQIRYVQASNTVCGEEAMQRESVLKNQKVKSNVSVSDSGNNEDTLAVMEIHYCQ